MNIYNLSEEQFGIDKKRIAEQLWVALYACDNLGIDKQLITHIMFFIVGGMVVQAEGIENFNKLVSKLKNFALKKEQYESKKVSKKRKPGKHNADPGKDRKRVVRKTKALSKKK